jgi:AraC family transcriptional regulator
MSAEGVSQAYGARGREAQISLTAALRRKHEAGTPGHMVGRALFARNGLEASDVICTSGPRDRSFEEAHSIASIAIVLSGTFSYRSPHGHTLMTPGSLLIGNRGSCFTCGHDHGEGDRCLAFMFEPELLERIAADAGARSTDVGAHHMPFLRSNAPLIAQAVASLGDPAALEEVGITLAKSVLTARHAGHAPRIVARDERRVSEIVRHIEGTFEHPHTLLNLAERAGLSPYHFLRVFRRVAGVSPHQFLLRLRLNAAALKLRTSHDPITDIAYAVGFDDLSNFIRTFRAEFGVAPSQYRGA